MHCDAFLKKWQGHAATAFQVELLLRLAAVLERSPECLGAAVVGFAPGRGELVAYRHGDRWLPWELFNCIKWLSRGEVATAREYLVQLGRAIEARRENGS